MIKIIIELSKDETLEYTPEDAYTVYRELRRVFERGSLSKPQVWRNLCSDYKTPVRLSAVRGDTLSGRWLDL